MEFFILIAAASSLLLPAGSALAGFVICVSAWLWMRRGRGVPIWLGLGIAVTAVLLAAQVTVDLRPQDGQRLESDIRARYEGWWRALDRAAEEAAAGLQGIERPRDTPLDVFQRLAGQAANEDVEVTLLMLDRSGAVVAWGGKGLLHDIGGAGELPEGRISRASFSAVTLASVRRINLGGEEFRLVAGSSLRIDTFPFASVGSGPARWTVVAAGEPIDAGAMRISPGDGPELVLEDLQQSERLDAASDSWRRAAWLVWGLSLLVWGWHRRRAALGSALVVAAGLGLLSLVSGVPAWTTALLMAASVVGSLAGWPGRLGGPGWVAAALGAIVALLLPAAAILGSRLHPLPNLGDTLSPDGAEMLMRMALAMGVWAALALVGSRGAEEARVGSRLLVAVLISASLAAAAADWRVTPWLLLALAGALTALWKRGRPVSSRLSSFTVLGLLAATLSAVGWELAYREVQKQRVGGPLLAAMAPPTELEIASVADAMRDFFAGADLGSLAPVSIEGLERQDLAFEVWHHSPLANQPGLSALRVLPADGGVASFSFGLPLNEEQWVDWTSPLWGPVSVPEWQDAVIVGDGQLHSNGEPWAYAEYALLLEPGFRIEAEEEDELAEVLLRAGPRLAEPDFSAIGTLTYGLYSVDGRPIVSPWIQPPELPAGLRDGGVARLVTPDGPSLAYAAVGSDGVRVLFLPRLSPPAGLERAGTHALPTLALLGLGLLLCSLPRLSALGLRQAWYSLWHSYSRRLALVYSILLLLPLGIINLIVVRALEDRLLREQEAAGLLAMESAQSVLGEYVLTLEPGFGIDAVLDDQVLFWLSGIVHHDLNLYWRGSVYASSKAELFTAGLLPRRIPGEIYSGLTLRSHKVSMRTQSTGRTEYLELYAPVTVPGVTLERTRLILSMPLLAQQQETAARIASLRRRSLLGTIAVVLLIVSIGARLARRFTAPLTDIVSGTQRIAAGESSLRLKPVELELATLVEAIDDMAARIHAGRQELLREKNLVDKMVENITAGVVSVDRQQRVLMANRIAMDLVGAEIGEELGSVLQQRPALGPLVEFLSHLDPDQLTQQTISLPKVTGGSEDWSVVWVPLPGEGDPSALLVLEDVTEVLRGQRLQAWAEMARMIAHEIKNPLTPIRLSAEHMREVHAADPGGFDKVFEDCTSNILQQVDELQEIASEFSTYSRIPRIEPRRGDLVATIAEVVAAYGAATRAGVQVRLESEQPSLVTSFDPKLLGRAVRNLLENALRVTPRGGEIVVRIESDSQQARISVADTGPGVKEALVERIFDPYFSTHDAGTGLGLPIARRIVEEHGGGLTARNRSQGGLEVVINLPVGSA